MVPAEVPGEGSVRHSTRHILHSMAPVREGDEVVVVSCKADEEGYLGKYAVRRARGTVIAANDEAVFLKMDDGERWWFWNEGVEKAGAPI